jgi:hypothetical protein
MIEKCLRMFELFESSCSMKSPTRLLALTHSATIARSVNFSTRLPLKHLATIKRLQTKHDVASGCLLGLTEATIQAGVLEIVAYILNVDSRVMMHPTHADSTNHVRCLEHVNPHHTICWRRFKARGILDRTFLTSAIAKQVAENPLTFAVAVVPIKSHEKIVPKDEAGAVRAETYMIFRLVEVAARVTKLEYSCSLDFKGRVPQIVRDTLAGPVQMGLVRACVVYFQQIRPLGECDAEDGRVVGQLLLELVEEEPKDLAAHIRNFVNRTAMLRECGFRCIGAMLTRLLTEDAEGGLDADVPITALNPSTVTEKQATAIGSAIASSLHRSNVPATALRKVLESHAVLRTMKSGHVWFVPMLDVLTAHMVAKSHPSGWMKRFSSIVTPTDMASDANRDVERGFRPVVPPA